MQHGIAGMHAKIEAFKFTTWQGPPVGLKHAKLGSVCGCFALQKQNLKNRKKAPWAMCVRPGCQIFIGVEASMHECCVGNTHPALGVLCKGRGWLFLANFTNWHPLPAQPCMVQVHRSSAWRCFVLRWLHGRLCPPT